MQHAPITGLTLLTSTTNRSKISRDKSYVLHTTSGPLQPDSDPSTNTVSVGGISRPRTAARCLKPPVHASGPAPRPLDVRSAAETHRLWRAAAPATTHLVVVTPHLLRRRPGPCPVRRIRPPGTGPARGGAPAEALPRRHNWPVNRPPAAAAPEERRRRRPLTRRRIAATAVVLSRDRRQQGPAAQPAAQAPPEDEQRLARGGISRRWLSEPGRR